MEVTEKDAAKQEFKEIKLTEKQLQIIAGIFSLKSQLENEHKRATERESEFVITVCESAGVEAVQGVKFENGSLLVPIESGKLAAKKKK